MRVLFSIFLLCMSMEVANAIDAANARNSSDLTLLLLNQVEVQSLSHTNPTVIHPKANLTVNYNPDPRVYKEGYLDYFKNSLAGNEAQENIERYAGIHSESNFSFSLRIERNPTKGNYDVEKIVEVLTEGITLNERRMFKTRISTFNTRKLENVTECVGYLYNGQVEGHLRRLYRKKDVKYTQAKFECKTLTRPVCNAVYRMEKINQNPFLYERSALHDRIEMDVLDAVNYQLVQKENMKDLKAADIPGGRRVIPWPRDPALQHYSGIGENGRGLTKKEYNWFLDECKQRTAFFYDPFLRIDQFDDDSNGKSNSVGYNPYRRTSSTRN